MFALFCAMGLLAGCGGSPPSGFPDVDNARRLARDAECPDLSGTYRVEPDPDSGFDLQQTPMGLDEDPSWSTFTLSYDSNGALTFSRRMPTESLLQAALALRASDPEAYMAWRQRALQGLDMSQDDRARAIEKYFAALADLGPAQERQGAAGFGLCDDGWVSVERMLPRRNDYPGYYSEGSIWLTRDAGGGLLARTLAGERHEITVWCGDGCKGIPYYTSTAKLWARFAPAESPPLWIPDAQALPVWPDPPTQAQIERQQRLEAQRGMPALVSVPVPDARVPLLKERILKLLGPSDRMLYFEQDRDGVSFSGSSESRADLDRLIAAIGNDPVVAKVDLVTILIEGRDHQRFSLEIRLQP